LQQARSLGILPAAFNPPTNAHIALARAAFDVVDSVLLVLPEVLPHKDFTGAPFASRVEMIRRVAAAEPRFGAAISQGGLFLDIAREVRDLWPEAELLFICGRDAAERIVGWEYGDPNAIGRMLTDARLLVASREGAYTPPEHLAEYVHPLHAATHQACSSTAVRELIGRGDAGWIDLVPGEIADLVFRTYSPAS
jgi:nicotinic acid mononucleotide adenylyltransferase